MNDSNQENYALRLSDIPQHPNQSLNLEPIQGYENEPLVSLAEAVQPLTSIVPDIDRMIDLVKSRLKTPRDGLSLEESASIMLYSLPWSTTENIKPFYLTLNSVLRNQQRQLLRPWFLYLKLFLTALSKLPSQTFTVFRGVKDDLRNQYHVNDKFVWWAFTSCTRQINVLNSETFYGRTGARTLFAILCHSGKDISQHSFILNESEILLQAARKFKVLGKLEQNDGSCIIQLEEIEPDLPLLARLPIDHPSALLSNIDNYTNAEIKQIISKCQSHTLDFRARCLNDIDIEFIITRGINEKQCAILDLSGVEITRSGILILAHALKDNKHLEELNLSRANLSELDIRPLTSMINSSMLKRLYLEENNLSDDDAKYLAEMFQTNTKLVDLSLSVNQITSSGVNLLAKVLTRPNVCLQIIDLSGNKNVDGECIDSIVAMIENSQSLKKLDLRRCNFSNESKIRLRTVAKSVKEFVLWF